MIDLRNVLGVNDVDGDLVRTLDVNRGLFQISNLDRLHHEWKGGITFDGKWARHHQAGKLPALSLHDDIHSDSIRRS